MKINDFFDLDSWKESHRLVIAIYKLVRRLPKDERYGIVDQLRRASSSITANIAEGFGRYHFKDKIRFYYQARGSVNEVENFLLLAKDLGYVVKNDLTGIWRLCKKSEMLINGLIRSTDKQN
jgi:four helix bundle protein